jgi:hypothetical protein
MRKSVTRAGENEKSFERKNSSTEIRRETKKPGVERGIREKREEGEGGKKSEWKNGGKRKKGKEKALENG